MTSRNFRNVAVGLLVVSVLLTGCKKKQAEVIDDDFAEPTSEAPVTQPAEIFVLPAEQRPQPVVATPPTTITPAAAPAEAKAVQVMLQTTRGDVVLELNQTAAPVTVANFVQYVKDGFYDGTVFHWVIDGFMIQGGGFTENMVEKKTRSEIINEAANGLKNERGTIAMARTGLPHSATSQFYINHKDNRMLDYGICPDGYGYTVFGKVIRGMEVVDAIATAETVAQGGEKSLPVQPVSIKKATVVSGG